MVGVKVKLEMMLMIDEIDSLEFYWLDSLALTLFIVIMVVPAILREICLAKKRRPHIFIVEGSFELWGKGEDKM
eukprot:8716121-Ditylum_brightwellii.AAC.1